MEAFAVATTFGESEWESSLSRSQSIINDHYLLQQFCYNPDPHPFPDDDRLATRTSFVTIFDDENPYYNFNCHPLENSSSAESDDKAAGGGLDGFLHDASIDQSMIRCGYGDFVAPMIPDVGLMFEEMGFQVRTENDDPCQHGTDHHNAAKRKHETPAAGFHNEANNKILPDISATKKKPRIPGDAQNSKTNSSPKLDKNGNENINVQSSLITSTSTATSDENDSSNNVSNTKSKKASRGPATDPQSLYARRRRERINERLKILQNLVPNGTKVDISTMLEEAVNYVKFLQLQIKLLGSDDMWMYAPIAYNGMDIEFYKKISPNLCPQN